MEAWNVLSWQIRLKWTRELAKTENVAFVDLTNLVADRYEQMGQAAVTPLFPKDHTHTNETGAELNARSVVAGLKATRENAIIRTFSAAGRAIEISFLHVRCAAQTQTSYIVGT